MRPPQACFAAWPVPPPIAATTLAGRVLFRLTPAAVVAALRARLK
jgi:hypothetical protein